MVQLCREMGTLPPHRLLLFQLLATTVTPVEGIKLHSKRSLYYPTEVPAFYNPYLTAAN